VKMSSFLWQLPDDVTRSQTGSRRMAPVNQKYYRLIQSVIITVTVVFDSFALRSVDQARQTRKQNQCSRKCMQQLKKRKKSCFWILKNVKRTYSFTGHLITLLLIYSITEVGTGKSPTSNILLRNADTRICNLELHVLNGYKFP